MKLFKVAASLVLCLSTFGNLAQSPADLPRVESFFQRAKTADARLSPSGKYLAIIAREAQGHARLLIVETQEFKPVGLIAGGSGSDVRSMQWINENRVFFETVTPDDSATGVTLGTFAADRDGKSLVQLTTSDGDFNQASQATRIESKVLPWEYEFETTLNDGSDDVVVSKALFSYTDYSLDQVVLYRLDTRSRHLTRLLSTSDPAPPLAITDWTIDREGKPRIAVHRKKGRRIVFYLPPGASKWEKLGDFNALTDEGFNPAFFGFDETLYVTTAKAGDATTSLYRYDLKNRKLADEPLIRLEGFDFSGRPQLDYKARRVVGIHYITDAAGSGWLDAKFREYQKKIDAALPGMVNTITCGDCLSSEKLLVASSSDRQPPRYYLFDAASARMAQIAEARPDIKAVQMGGREFFRFKARDGLSIPVYVTTPPVKATGPMPAVVLVHGGPWVRGGSWEWDAEAQFLASRGYVVLQPEFRGSEGFGYKHFDAGRRQWGLAMQDDLADTAKWAIAKGMADPKRIAIAGASYGGYATLMGLIKDPELFRCGFEWVGVTDINLMFTSMRGDFSNDVLQYDLKNLIGDPDADAAALRKVSPLEQAARLKQPVLLAAGGRDSRVPTVHFTAFRSAVSSTNKNVEWLFYPEAGHGWYLEKDNFDFWTHVEKFLDTNLKNAR